MDVCPGVNDDVQVPGNVVDHVAVFVKRFVDEAVHVCALVVVMVAEIDVESAGVDVRDGVGFVERVRVQEPDEVVVGVIAGVPVAVSEVVTVE